MISKEDTEKLADLARIELQEEEKVKLAGEMEAILGYVSQVSSVAGDSSGEIEVGDNYNVWREDGNATPPGTYSKELIAEFPESLDNYLKVKKIL